MVYFIVSLTNSNDFDKIIYLLKELYKKSDYQLFVDLLTFSDIRFEENSKQTKKVFNVRISTVPEVYLKYYETIDAIAKSIKSNIEKISELKIDKIIILPDYNKIEIINSEIRPVFTPWDEINTEQSKLISLLKTSSDSIDLQNIGNTSRRILKKIANIVFMPEKHTPNEKHFDVNPEKFKNQLHSYIKTELAGNKNKELRQFAEAAINIVEKAIDLANTLTHKSEPVKIIAEVCVIGTISAISIIKFVDKNKG